MATQFLLDDVLEENKERLNEIVQTLNEKPETKVLKTFTFALIKAHQKRLKPLQQPSIQEQPEKLLKPSLLKITPSEEKIISQQPILQPTPIQPMLLKPQAIELPKPVQPLEIQKPSIPKPSIPKLIPPIIPEKKETKPIIPKKIEPKKLLKPTIPEIILPEKIEESHALIGIKNKILAQALINDIYNLIEIPLTEQDLKLYNLLKHKVKHFSDKKLVKLTKKLSKKLNIPYSDDKVDKMRYYIIRDFRDLGKIEPFLHDPAISIIFCDEINQPVTVRYKDKEMKTNISFKTKEELDAFVKMLAAKVGIKLSERNPIVDSKYKNLRVQITLGDEFMTSRFVIARE